MMCDHFPVLGILRCHRAVFQVAVMMLTNATRRGVLKQGQSEPSCKSCCTSGFHHGLMKFWGTCAWRLSDAGEYQRAGQLNVVILIGYDVCGTVVS
jgi:hypothetical protein